MSSEVAEVLADIISAAEEQGYLALCEVDAALAAARATVVKLTEKRRVEEHRER